MQLVSNKKSSWLMTLHHWPTAITNKKIGESYITPPNKLTIKKLQLIINLFFISLLLIHKIMYFMLIYKSFADILVSITIKFVRLKIAV